MADGIEPSSDQEMNAEPAPEVTSDEKKGEQKGAGGAMAIAIGMILAVGGGILKQSDGLWKPLLKHGDELAQTASRHVDDASMPRFSRVENIGPSAASHADDSTSKQQDDSLALLWDVAGEGAKGLGSLTSETKTKTPRGNLGLSRKTMTYEIEVVSRELMESYRQRDDGAYHIEERHCVKTMLTRQEGAVESVDEEVDRQLPDEDRGEYTWFALRRDGDSTLLREKSRTLLGKCNLDFDFELEVEFDEGNWSEFEAGNRVVLRYTQKSHEMIRKVCQEQMEAQMHQIASQSPDISIAAMDFLEVPKSSFIFHGKELHRTTSGCERLLMRMLRSE